MISENRIIILSTWKLRLKDFALMICHYEMQSILENVVEDCDKIKAVKVCNVEFSTTVFTELIFNK